MPFWIGGNSSFKSKEIPTEVVLIEEGEITYTNQDPYKKVKYTRAFFEEIISNNRKIGKDIVFDYEHQTLSGNDAPASGWISANDLFYDPARRALVGKIKEWTKRAQEYIKNGEYRFISPVVDPNFVDSKTGKRLGKVLHSAALTNDPLMQNLPALTAKKGVEKDMDFLKKLIAKLGLKEGATEDEAIEAVAGLLSAKADANKKIASKEVLELLGAKEGDPVEEIKTLVAKMKEPVKKDPDPQKWVAKTDFDNVNQDLVTATSRITALENSAKEKSADEAVEGALVAGRLTPAQKDWAKSYALKDPEGFGKYMEGAPQVVPLGEIEGLDLSKQNTGDKESLIAKYQTDNKCSYKDAAIEVSRQNPQLFN